MTLIHLVFKTHLDIGFTDHAAKIRQTYHDQFIPQALTTAEHFQRENPAEPLFVWTTGAWLIHDHLTSQRPQKVRRLERAIEAGLITWHAMPFTTHSEMMSADVFRAGLSYADELDARFGRKTRAAKMTDVPGHTIGIVPLLAEAGVRFLHLGVNTASPVPDVPPVFRWQAPDGSEIIVMYQDSYGGTDFPIGPGIGLSFAHTQDNIGPQTVAQVIEARRPLEKTGARVLASTLDAFAAEVWARRETLPIVTDEIGDSWIHGIASDPQKQARYRSLQRRHDAMVPGPGRTALGRSLAMVAEHTWGVDIKTYLRDERAWDRADFEAARANDPRFAFTEASWAEQRAFLDAVWPDDLSMPAPPNLPDPGPGATIRDRGWKAEVDPVTGDLVSLTSPQGYKVGSPGSLMGFRHETYDHQALQSHLDSYLQHRMDWAVLDHDKPGLQHARSARTAVFAPEALGVSVGMSQARMPRIAHDDLGAPGLVALALRGLDDHRAEITLALTGKPASRLPEAGFLHLCPGSGPIRLRKMGLWLDPGRQARRAGGQLQAVEALRFGDLDVEPLDAALVAPFAAPFLPFQPDPPDFSEGVRFNLYNTKWGTNFPMWIEGDMVFRFVVSVPAGAPARTDPKGDRAGPES